MSGNFGVSVLKRISRADSSNESIPHLRTLIERALSDFQRLARIFNEGEAEGRELQSMIRHPQRAWEIENGQEMVLESFNATNGSLDYRSIERRAWSDVLEDELPPADVD